MRGDPPLIGGAKAQGAIIGDRGNRGKPQRLTGRPAPAARPARDARYNRPHRHRPAFSAIDSRPNVRPSRRVVLVAAGGLAAAAATLAFFLGAPVTGPPEQIGTPEHAGELVALVRPGPAVYFPGPDGSVEGLDAELLRRFAIEKKLPLRFVAVHDLPSMVAALEGGEAHVGAGGLLRPVDGDRKSVV